MLTLALGVSGVAGWWWINRDHAPVVLTVGSGPYGSDSNVLMRHIAEVVERHSHTLRLAVRSTRDPSENIARLNTRQIDLAVIRADTPVVSDVRMIADLFPDYFQIVVRDSAPARKVADLPRLRVAIPEFGTDAFRSFWVLADHYDLPVTNDYWRSVPFGQATAGLLSGRYDALFTVRSLRDETLLRMFGDAQLKSIRLRYIPVEQAAAIALKRPFLRPEIMPVGAFTGAAPVPEGQTPTAAVERILVSRADIPAEAIRELTSILFEHRLDLTMRFSLASAISKPDLQRGLNVPLHDGAAAFYDRDEPSFIQQNAEPLALGVTLLAMAFSGLLGLRRLMTNKQKNRADVYNYRLLDLNTRARTATSRDELATLRDELDAILETVVVALDTDEVTDEGFQSFSLLWESVRDTLRERRADLEAAQASA
ncbi:TAXI family TRAP transporter solute-binding subunit [Zhengella mangrovi]|uniref:TAXI family TRAP transporter solute-binding subunit n=1 Tax=Zhengella mangrovi TaxID=1982044 RepID=UPI0013FD87C5|nr:TAXI family TRAP transporter solute-binding subunit [Zhengella mangrovi]